MSCYVCPIRLFKELNQMAAVRMGFGQDAKKQQANSQEVPIRTKNLGYMLNVC